MFPPSSFTFAKKILFMRFLYVLFTCCLIGFMSCGNNTNTTPTTQNTVITTVKPVSSKLGDNSTRLLTNMVAQYYGLKNALVASKGARADSAALLLEQAADSFQASLLKDTSNATALKPFLDTIIGYSNAVYITADPSCERQRLPFGAISSALFGLLKNVEIKNAGIYRDYCPMAYNEKGAYWLSEESEIKNPFFGKKMLECGEVTDSLK